MNPRVAMLPRPVERPCEVAPSGRLSERVKRAVTWSCAGAVFLRASSFAAWVFCGRYLGKAAFGELSIVVSTAGTLGILAGMGLGVTVTRYTAEYRSVDAARAGRVIGLTLLLVSLSAGLVTALMFLAAPLMGTDLLLAPHMVPALRIAVLLIGLNALNACQTGALTGLEAFRSLACVNLWSGLCSLPLVVLCTRQAGLAGAVWGLVAAQAVNCVLNQIALRSECRRSGVSCSMSGCRHELPMLWQSALPALLSSALLLPAVWSCSAWLARQSGGYEQLGLYAAADRWRLLILFAPGSLAGTALPILSNLRGCEDGSGFQRIFRTYALANVLLAFVPAVAVAVAARPLLSVFGSAYPEAWPVLTVLALAAGSEAMNTALGQAVVAESMWRRFGFDALLVITLGSCAWLLVPRWGALGLAAAFLCAYSVVAATLWRYSRHSLSSVGGALDCLES